MKTLDSDDARIASKTTLDFRRFSAKISPGFEKKPKRFASADRPS